MFRFFIVIISLLLPFSTYADNKKQSAETYSKLELYCFTALKNPDKARKIAALNGKPLSSVQEGKKWKDTYFGKVQGKAWFVQGKHSKGFLISLTKKDVCTLSAPTVDAFSVLEIFEKQIKNKFLTKQKSGSHIHRWYAIKLDKASNSSLEALVMITTSDLSSSVGSGIIFNIIPKALARQRINMSKWPEL